MKVYIEEVFILNFLLDFMILYGTKRILKRNNKLIRVVIGSIIGSFTTFLLFININSFILLILKLLISIILIIIVFGFRNIIKNIIYFYLLSIIIGGSAYLLNINNVFFLIISSFIVISILIKEFLSYKETFINKYLVTIIINKKKYLLEGFIDTGNRLVDPISKKSIVLVNLNIDSDRFIYVPYKALNCNGIIKCIKPDKVLINDHVFDCLIGISKDKFNIEENCILPNKLKEELCL
ncbi:MAG: sigma-E processing peptidase SpoIIGA [Bacilli bacterium]|nr:sigma-E processing peptidase SpoIIGA [Bacilli bacterium]